MYYYILLLYELYLPTNRPPMASCFRSAGFSAIAPTTPGDGGGQAQGGAPVGKLIGKPWEKAWKTNRKTRNIGICL